LLYTSFFLFLFSIAIFLFFVFVTDSFVSRTPFFFCHDDQGANRVGTSWGAWRLGRSQPCAMECQGKAERCTACNRTPSPGGARQLSTA
jgi:hypothetical protein